MLDIVNYSRESNLLFDVGVADALSNNLLVVLETAVIDREQIHLRCFESDSRIVVRAIKSA